MSVGLKKCILFIVFPIPIFVLIETQVNYLFLIQFNFELLKVDRLPNFPEKITIVGAGNVAWHLAHAFHKAKIKIDSIINRDPTKGQELADAVGALYSSDFNFSTNNRQFIILAVSDSSLPEVLNKLQTSNHIVLHTSGSVDIGLFKGKAAHCGALYPFQTLTRKVETDYSRISLFLEASDEETYKAIEYLAINISSNVYRMSSEQRRKLHLAGIISNNFTNHLVTLAYDYLSKNNIDEKYLLPLLEETLNKMKIVGPHVAQTGPAKRNNKEIIDMHLQMLKDDHQLKNLYKEISDSIIAYYSK